MRICNSTKQVITLCTDLGNTVILSGGIVNVNIPEEAVFNAPDGSFYVETPGSYYIKYSGANAEIYRDDEELQQEGLIIQGKYK